MSNPAGIERHDASSRSHWQPNHEWPDSRFPNDFQAQPIFLWERIRQRQLGVRLHGRDQSVRFKSPDSFQRIAAKINLGQQIDRSRPLADGAVGSISRLLRGGSSVSADFEAERRLLAVDLSDVPGRVGPNRNAAITTQTNSPTTAPT